LLLQVVFDDLFDNLLLFSPIEFFFFPAEILVEKLDAEAIQVFVHIVVYGHKQSFLSCLAFDVDVEFTISDLHDIAEFRVDHWLVHLPELVKAIIDDGLLIFFIEQAGDFFLLIVRDLYDGLVQKALI